jgi:hypothetical protein
MIIEKMQAAGLCVDLEGGRLKVTGTITDEQREFIRAHKAELLAELKAANQPTPTERLRTLAGKYRIDPDELMSWYSQDQSDIQAMDDLTLDAMVRDYACNRSTFRNEKPYEIYQLWLYRLDKKKPGYVRQGIMTTEKAEALRRLEAIYGTGNVFDLHRKELND